MAHFTRVRPSGFWTSNSNLLSSEMEGFDSRLYKAINGDDGGVWAPAAQVEIGGAGIKITGAGVFTGGLVSNTVSVSNTLTVQGATTLDDDLTVNGSVAVSTDLAVQGDSALSTLAINGALDVGFKLSVHGNSKLSGALTVTGAGSINGNAILSGTLSVADDATFDTYVAINTAADHSYRLKVNGAARFIGAVTTDTQATIGGNLTVSGSTSVVGLSASAGVSFGASLTVNNDVTAGGDISAGGDIDAGGTITGIGRIKRRTYTFPSDADATIGIANGDVFYMPNGLMTTTRTITLSTAAATTGDQLTVCTLDASHILYVGSYGLRYATGLSQFATFTFISGAWVLTAYAVMLHGVAAVALDN